MVDSVQPKPFKAGFKTGRYDPSGMQPAIKVACPSPLATDTVCHASVKLLVCGRADQHLRAQQHTKHLFGAVSSKGTESCFTFRAL